ncbi:hypothetical protein M3C29_010505 [Micrococcus luteus]|nr:hypothetical protein [Micrococcus luteus]CVM17436.1 conjugative transposon DNA recombination protein [Streptococcus pneumoniae]
MADRVCEGCGQRLNLARSDARTCSTKCRVRVHRAAKRAAERAELARIAVDQVIPARMRERDRWMRWAPARRGSRITKRPVTVAGAPASSTNAATWSTYSEARASEVGTGLGFALGDGIGCYDLDDALSGGVLEPWAAEFLATIPEPVLFMEVSQSGNGVHAFIEAAEGPGRVIRDGRKIERYTAGRFIAVTGAPFELGATA